MELTAALQKLDQLQRKQLAYSHAMGLIDYDGMTAAPSGTAANRAETLGILAEEVYKLSTGDETVALLDELHARMDELDEVHQRIVKVMYKNIDETRRIPMEEYVAYQKLTTESDAIWHTAKENNDYALFMPYLERLIAQTQRIMRYIKPDQPVYDTLLDRFETGLTRAKCDAFFDVVRRELVPFIHRVTAAKQVDDSPLHGHFPLDKQRQLSDYLMQVIGWIAHTAPSPKPSIPSPPALPSTMCASPPIIWRITFLPPCTASSTRAATRSMIPTRWTSWPTPCGAAAYPWAFTKASPASLKTSLAAAAALSA